MPAFYPEGDEPKLADPSGRSLHKINNLLKSIDAKTGSTTITGPVTVSNEVEVTNSTGNPIPVSGTVGLDATSLAALENISVTFPATQNVNVTNAGLNVSASTLPLPAGASTETTLASVDTRLSNIDSDLGSTSESAASTDTSISGINGLLKRLLQRITTLIYPPFASGSFTNSGGASTGIDCGGYDYLVQHVSGGGGGLNRPIQWSYDNVNWTQGGVVFRHISNAGSSSTGNEAHWTVLGDILGTSSGIFVIPVVGRYFRVGVGTTAGGGSWTHNWYLHKGPFPGIVEEGIGSRSSTAAATDTADVGLNGLFKRLLQRLTTLLPANLTVSSTRLLVDGSGVTQPTRETQPTNDYAINTTALGSFSLSGSAAQSASFDAGANADYVVISIAGGGSSGALYYDLSTDNSTWDAGNVSGGFVTYYDRPATSTTDAYSYKSASGPSFFGGTLSGYSARLIVPLQQSTPGPGTQKFYRYIRLNAPASNGGWRYKFTSYKSVDPLLASSVPGNPSTTRVAGRVDVGFISNLPALPTGANTIGSVNVLGGNATAVKVDGSAVTQPVSIASAPVTPVTDNGGSLTVDGSITATQATAASLKAQAQLLNAAGSVVDYAMTGTAGTPATDVVTVQGISGGTSIPISGTVNTYPQQGTTVTNSNFISITSAELAPAVANREVLTVYNEGPGTLFINVGGSCSTTSYQARLFSGEYWEAPAGQQSLQHSGIFSTAGTARVTQIS
jgi:hypothetical protein